MAKDKPRGTGLKLDVVTDFDFLSQAYRDLYSASDATAFQAPIWLATIQSRLMPKVSGTPYTITVRDSDGSLVAVLPLALQKTTGITLLTPADFGVSDYNAIVASSATLERLAVDTAALDRLDALLRKGGLLMFRKARNDGFDLGRIFRRSSSTTAENSAYHTTVDSDFDTWRLKTLSRHMTKELGRKGRQLEAEFGSYVDRAVTDEASIREAMAFIRDTRKGRFDDDLLQRDDYFDFYCAYAVAAAAAGEAEMWVSYVDGRPVAALFGLTGDGTFHAVLIAANIEEFSRYSLGTQIIYRTIRERFSRGARTFDMGLGNSGYKSHFRVESTSLSNLTRANSLRGAGVALVYNRARSLKNAIRRYAPNLR